MARKYKDSGIEWIGQIPKEWRICLTSSLFHEHKEKNIGLKNTNLLSLSYGKIKRKDINTNEGLLPQSFETYNVIKVGDIVFRLTDLQNDKRSLRTGLCEEEGIITSAYVTLRANNAVYCTYFHYLFHSYDECKVFYGLGDGVRQGMNWVDVKNLVIFEPPFYEQQKIADYLDKVCGEADEMIALQEKMIEELKAYKQSIITEAVTKGLNPNVPMKNSGIDWIGEIPEGWKVKRLKEIFLLQTGTTPKDYANGLDTDNLINWFTPSDVSEMNCELNGSQRHLSKNVADGEGIKLYPKGSLIFVAIGASAGKIGYINIEGYSNQQITALIPQNNCYSKYFYYYMLADRKRIRDNAFFTTLPIINNGYLSSVKILLPPLSEQQSIASYLDTKCSEIDSLIAIKQQKITELKEYKKSVIYEYVTGKKEVV